MSAPPSSHVYTKWSAVLNNQCTKLGVAAVQSKDEVQVGRLNCHRGCGLWMVKHRDTYDSCDFDMLVDIWFA